MSATEQITCDCGNVFDWTPEDCDAQWVISYIRPKRCLTCEQRAQRDLEEQKRTEHEAEVAAHNGVIMAEVEKATPALFRATDTTHPRFNVKAWDRLKTWKPSTDKPWLGLVGATGECKTRIAYLLAGHEVKRMAKMPRIPSFQFVASYEISDLTAKLNAPSFTEKHDARRALDEMRRVNFLIIDDLGKGKLSPSVAAELFALVDHRYCHALPMIWTANSMPEVFAAVMPDDIGAPFAGRLLDSSRILKL